MILVVLNRKICRRERKQAVGDKGFLENIAAGKTSIWLIDSLSEKKSRQ